MGTLNNLVYLNNAPVKRSRKGTTVMSRPMHKRRRPGWVVAVTATLGLVVAPIAAASAADEESAPDVEMTEQLTQSVEDTTATDDSAPAEEDVAVESQSSASEPAPEPEAQSASKPEEPEQVETPEPQVNDPPAAAMVKTLGKKGGDKQPKKVFVCKYVGTPGEDERLQTGQNPISVSINAIKNFDGVGSYFNDAHGRSYVLAFDTGQPKPDVSDCPAAEQPKPKSSALYLYKKVDGSQPASWENSAHQDRKFTWAGWSWATEFPGTLPAEVCGDGWAVQQDQAWGTEDIFPAVVDRTTGEGVLGWPPITAAIHQDLSVLVDVPPCDEPPPAPQCPENYFQDQDMWEITWGKQFTDTNGVPTFTMDSYGGLTSLNGGDVPAYMTDAATWHWLYVRGSDDGRVVTYGFADGTVITATVSIPEDGCPSVNWEVKEPVLDLVVTIGSPVCVTEGATVSVGVDNTASTVGTDIEVFVNGTSRTQGPIEAGQTLDILIGDGAAGGALLGEGSHEIIVKYWSLDNELVVAKTVTVVVNCDELPPVTTPLPDAPSPNDQCGTENDGWDNVGNGEISGSSNDENTSFVVYFAPEGTVFDVEAAEELYGDLPWFSSVIETHMTFKWTFTDEPCEEPPVKVTPVEPTFTSPTCDAPGSVEAIDTDQYEWVRTGPDSAAIYTATAKGNVKLEGKTVFGPYDLTQLTGEECEEPPVEAENEFSVTVDKCDDLRSDPNGVVTLSFTNTDDDTDNPVTATVMVKHSEGLSSYSGSFDDVADGESSVIVVSDLWFGNYTAQFFVGDKLVKEVTFKVVACELPPPPENPEEPPATPENPEKPEPPATPDQPENDVPVAKTDWGTHQQDGTPSPLMGLFLLGGAVLVTAGFGITRKLRSQRAGR